MFPPINVQRTKLSACQRVVLVCRDKETGTQLESAC
jgi:ribosome biogenesis protein SSF1/2